MVLASYSDTLWAPHAIFLPHEHLLKPREHSLPFVQKISRRAHGDHQKANLHLKAVGRGGRLREKPKESLRRRLAWCLQRHFPQNFEFKNMFCKDFPGSSRFSVKVQYKVVYHRLTP